ncbi:MAG: hypothetical protein QGH70_07800 [Nitrospinota bacterium]|nr:hypothetical protein [Nitrospinota bacterium]
MQPLSHCADFHAAVEEYHRRGWTDGLPVVPPTGERLAEFLAAGGMDEGEVVFRLEERGCAVPAGKVALNAIMAGCLPAYMPVLLAALEAMADPAYNLHGSAASTGGAAPLMVVNGPVRNEIGMNGGGNVFGPGNRANAAIGRAIRLVLINCLDAVPHLLDRSTQGNPGKYSFTFAEDEEASPWESLHAERGIPPERSAVTLLAAEGPHNIQNHYGRAEGILRTAAHTMASLGSMGPGQGFVVFAPEHANIIAGEFPGKGAVREFLFARMGVPQELLQQTGKIDGPAWSADPARVPHGLDPGDIFIVVAGGEAGGHSAWIPAWSRGRNGLTVTRPVLCAEERRAKKG